MQTKLIDSHVDQIIIVTGYNYTTISPHIFNHKNIKTVYNKDYKFGQTSSFKKGVNAVSDHTKGIALFPIDYPFIKTETVDQMIEKFVRDQPDILLPTYHHKKGHPPIFSMALKKNILALENDVGINILTRSNQYQILQHEVNDSGIRATFNTAEEWQALLQRYQEN